MIDASVLHGEDILPAYPIKRKWRILVFGNDGACDRGIFLFDTRKACADYIYESERELRNGLVDEIAGERLRFTKATYGWAMPYPEATG